MTLRELLITGARELDIPLSSEQAGLMFLFLDELKKWNRKINLTAITADKDVVIKHLLDSLSYLKGFNPQSGMRLLDMGSGAGFPAIPIKIVQPDIAITLVESVKKKASFLRHVIRTLSLKSSEVMDIRIEELHNSYETGYDVVTARAFADMPSALSAGSRFLKPAGLMVLSRGPDEALENEGLRADAGIMLERRLELTLPFSDYKRAIWVFKKA